MENVHFCLKFLWISVHNSTLCVVQLCIPQCMHSTRLSLFSVMNEPKQFCQSLFGQNVLLYKSGHESQSNLYSWDFWWILKRSCDNVIILFTLLLFYLYFLHICNFYFLKKVCSICTVFQSEPALHKKPLSKEYIRFSLFKLFCRDTNSCSRDAAVLPRSNLIIYIPSLCLFLFMWSFSAMIYNRSTLPLHRHYWKIKSL